MCCGRVWRGGTATSQRGKDEDISSLATQAPALAYPRMAPSHLPAFDCSKTAMISGNIMDGTVTCKIALCCAQLWLPYKVSVPSRIA